MPPLAKPNVHGPPAGSDHWPTNVWGLAEQASDSRVRHLFGQLGNNAAAVDTLALNPYVVLPTLHWAPECRETRLWLIGTDATQVSRESRVTPLTPLTREQVQSGNNLPAGAIRTQNRSALQLMVELQRGAGQHRFFMDANQWVELESEGVTLTLFAPAGIVEVAPAIAQQGPQPEALDLVVDVLLGGSIVRIEESTGRHSVTFSQTVELDESGSIIIPPFAHAVRISQVVTEVAPAAAIWGQWIGGGPTTVPAGRITLTDGEAEAVVLPHASHLVAEGAGTFNLVWEIRP